MDKEEGDEIRALTELSYKFRKQKKKETAK